ncbi:phage tail tip fiber protein [Escherichia coli]|uniref:phage tail tip fiber protein n=1 Tax=Escherichia coli TaxID=562 RepID=UPI001868C039|nr:phage tail protein [Escherichia coli]
MSSGGGKAKTPTLLNDNLFHKQFYRVLDILSEGPIYGPVNQKAPLNSVMLNDTPITDANGGTSVPGVSVAWRNGTADQSPINGFNAIESTVIVNAKVTHDTPIIRTVSDPNVNRVRLNLGVDSLVQSDDKGNQYNTSVTLMVDVKPSSSTTWSLVKDIHIGPGKQSGEYLEAHIIKAPDEKPFDIRVRRVTPDSTGDLLHNDTRWSSYSEIIDDNLSYPHTAVAGAVIDHDQYTDTPTRTYHMRGLIVDVPDNYDPETRTYSGLWLGGFKKAYTNNPAWLFRYLVKNERFGLARHAGYIDVDDGALYTLSQYCDQLVNDGYGGLEPRMTLNAYITEQMSARDLLDNIAGMFRGIALWDGQRLTVMIDAPQDPIATITNANVVDGAFTRSSISRAECYNAVIVSWTDPENGWEQSKEYVADDELIARDGYNETTLEAFGCTSRGQAYRAGKWLIETAKREPSKFTFKMARDAIHFTPGDIIEILDNNRAGARLGGRIVANNGKVITVDKVDSDCVAAGDTISLLDSDGKFKKHQITGVDGNNITLAAAPAWIRNGTVFALSTEYAKPVLCRITSVAETENNSVYTIEAAQHDPHKQAVVDEGAIFEVNNDTLNHFRVPNIENLKVLNVGSETVQCRATWETQTTTHRLTFEIRVYNAEGRVVAAYETTNYRYDFYGLDAGSYTLGIRGRNDTGMKGAESIVDLVIGAPAAPIGVNWVPGVFQATVYPISKTTLTTDTAYEFYFSGENQITDPSKVTTLAQFTGRGYQWTFGGMNTGHTYYVYVRTRNAFGVSDFVEASGKPTENFDEISDYVTKDVINSEQFKGMIGDIKDLGDRADLIESATNDLKNATDSLKTATDNLTNITEDLRTDTDSLITETGEIKADTDTLKKETEDLYKKVGENTDGIGQHEVRIDSLEVSSERIDSELAQAKASLQNASLALINNSLAQTNTRVTLTAQYKKGQSETNAQIDRIDNVIAEEKKATAESLKTITAEMNTMDSNLKGQISSVERAVADEASARAEAINSVNASISNLDKKTDASVNRLDQAIADESSARAQAVSDVKASISNLESKTDASVSRLDKAIADETQARSAAITDVKADLTTLENSTNASVKRLDKAIADESSARAEAISGINAEIGNIENNVDKNSDDINQTKASLQNASIALINNSIAQTNTRVTLTAQYKKGHRETNAQIDRIDNVIAEEKKATAEAISGVNASITDLDKKTDASVNRLDQAIADETSARSEAISGVNASISTLDSNVTSNITRMDKAISDETKARADAISGLSASLTSTINSKVSEVSTALSTHETSSAEKFSQISASFDSVNSSITEWSQAMATADEALSSKIDQLTVTVNGNKTAIETTSKALTDFKGNIDASYSIKLATDNNGMKYATGMSIGLTGDGTNFQSQCIFLVDRFVLMTAANGTYTTPFYVENGAMYVREAFIKNGSIDNAKIGNVITSYNWNGSDQGWAIVKDGWATFNNVTVRGTVYANAGVFNGTVYATDGKFSGTLEATAFVGDVANMGVGNDKSSPGNSGSITHYFTYTDTSTSQLSKNIYLSVYISSDINPGGNISVEFDVAGIKKTVNAITASPTGNQQSFGSTVSCGFTGVKAANVSATITVKKGGAPNTKTYSPLMIVSRGNGSFSAA